MTFPELPARLASVRERIAAAQAPSGWIHDVAIIAVTKTHGADAVRAAAAAGITAVGENRVQEALGKQAELPGLRIDWHLIGSLQQNKARKAAGRFALIHSVDRAALATELDRRTPEGARQPVLVQVNCSAEPQKGGVEPADLPALLDALRGCARLEVRGLMTMAELTDDAARPRAAFALLRRLREAGQSDGHLLPELSMGMSGDFEAAVAEGATMVRLGTILFGGRNG
ncbi:MAG TPA: YggS family pyridoxal phosphate-dependent enzyme [Gemmatimonadales bacterium]|nr:YggS family pyridoxal phosphate-dependent enzyme [Gemmatimonadales bacterium]